MSQTTQSPPTNEAAEPSSQRGIPDILKKIVDRRRERLAEARGETPLPPAPETAPPLKTPADNRFLRGIMEQAGRAVIAEVKMGSPSLGSLEGSFDPVAQARLYADNQAAALSVVVEPDFFYGSYELLAKCVEASGLPAIAKDFIVDPLQIEWAKEAGASAVLLIAALYTQDQLVDYANRARAMDLVPLIETHDLAEIRRLKGYDWELVGVNNRDLRRFVTELSTSKALALSLPSRAIKVSESGISKGEDIAMLRQMGYQAFLIGESLVTSDDPAAKLRELRA